MPLGTFEPVPALRVDAAPLRADSGVITLLRWSDKPLEVFLDDEQSPVARVPPVGSRVARGDQRGAARPDLRRRQRSAPVRRADRARRKRHSEEPYTPEDRELLRGIAVQMGVALDLSRLRKQVGAHFCRRVRAGPESTRLHAHRGGRRQRHRPAIGVGAVVDGKYRVDAVIGQGGMGAVFRAWDLRLERPVAIKVVRADLIADPDSRARFRRESQIVARLQHPSIVTVFDYGNLADGAAFLVMEFVPGEDLRALLTRRAR